MAGETTGLMLRTMMLGVVGVMATQVNVAAVTGDALASWYQATW